MRLGVHRACNADGRLKNAETWFRQKSFVDESDGKVGPTLTSHTVTFAGSLPDSRKSGKVIPAETRGLRNPSLIAFGKTGHELSERIDGARDHPLFS